jgi:hypothetical protein
MTWAWVTITSQPAKPTKTVPIETGPGRWWLLVRRNHTPGELAFYRCYSPQPVPLTKLVRVAGQGWRIEESFQSSKNLAGLDHHQVRRWNSWHRWTLLAMLAHALLTVLAINERRRAATNSGTGIIALTCNEIHRLLNTLLAQTSTTRTDWPGRDGDDNTNTEPDSATTPAGATPHRRDSHEVRLPY